MATTKTARKKTATSVASAAPPSGQMTTIPPHKLEEGWQLNIGKGLSAALRSFIETCIKINKLPGSFDNWMLTGNQLTYVTTAARVRSRSGSKSAGRKSSAAATQVARA